MAKRKKKLPGLNRESKTGVWKLDKVIKNYGRLYRSTGTTEYAEAERRSIRWIKEIEDATIHGKRSSITFNEAAALYISTETKKSLKCDINDLKKVMPYIGTLYVDQVYQETLDPYIKHEQKTKKASTINRSIRVVSRVLTLCARSWRDDHHMPYLDAAPVITQLPENDKKTTPPIEYQEEEKLLSLLNADYQDFWRFAVNTGLREQNQAGLLWDWKVDMPALDTFGFLIPGMIEASSHDSTLVKNTKNGKDFLLVLNKTARDIIEKWAGRDEVYVFPSPKGGKYSRYNNKHFRNAREKAGLKGVITWHSARSSFATRLRAARVSEEDRAQLLGHSSRSITTQYSWADVRHLIECVEKLADEQTMDEDKKDLASLFRVS